MRSYQDGVNDCLKRFWGSDAGSGIQLRNFRLHEALCAKWSITAVRTAHVRIYIYNIHEYSLIYLCLYVYVYIGYKCMLNLSAKISGRQNENLCVLRLLRRLSKRTA